MKVAAIVMSRVLAFVDTADLSPTAGVNAPDFVREITKQFYFQKYPQKLEEFDATKGIEFLTGRFGKRAIPKFALWPNLLTIETRSNTTEAQALLGEMLTWAKDKFGLTYSAEMITHYAYISDLSF